MCLSNSGGGNEGEDEYLDEKEDEYEYLDTLYTKEEFKELLNTFETQKNDIIGKQKNIVNNLSKLKNYFISIRKLYYAIKARIERPKSNLDDIFNTLKERKESYIDETRLTNIKSEIEEKNDDGKIKLLDDKINELRSFIRIIEKIESEMERSNGALKIYINYFTDIDKIKNYELENKKNG